MLARADARPPWGDLLVAGATAGRCGRCWSVRVPVLVRGCVKFWHLVYGKEEERVE